MIDSEFIGEKRVRIKKVRKCWGCNQKYAKGSFMISATTKDITIDHTYWCIVCDDFIKTLTRENLECGFFRGDMWEYPNYKDFRENHQTKTIIE